jgi:hypothetical protein
MPELYRPAYVHDDDIEITQGQDWLIGFRLLAKTIFDGEYLLDTAGYTAAMTVRAGGFDGPAQLAVTTTTGELVVGFSPAAIERSTAYIAGQRGSAGGGLFQCNTAGTTDGSPVIFNTTIGSTTTDGTVGWVCIGTDATVCNLTIILPAAMTETLTPWGRGVYSIEVFDTYGHSVFYQDGAAYLRQEATY